jgi:hypothetical protein
MINKIGLSSLVVQNYSYNKRVSFGNQEALAIAYLTEARKLVENQEFQNALKSGGEIPIRYVNNIFQKYSRAVKEFLHVDNSNGKEIEAVLEAHAVLEKVLMNKKKIKSPDSINDDILLNIMKKFKQDVIDDSRNSGAVMELMTSIVYII